MFVVKDETCGALSERDSADVRGSREGYLIYVESIGRSPEQIFFMGFRLVIDDAVSRCANTLSFLALDEVGNDAAVFGFPLLAS